MEAPAKQQIVERVKQANNILVTVSANPSVDQLSACIGLTLLLNKMGKHATAVFSGQVPSTIEFLQPQKTIETNTDSLRDFIISLDKAKADKLRYKVEDQVVRIFITPYRTSLSEKDLVFSEGDFNVEVLLALGVKDRSHIDTAITAHGRILHDATVVSVNAGPGNPPALGQINWQEPTASSLCEMVVSVSEAFGTGLIDNQMATAFLTGIVAETQRFSNPKTSPKVMTMSAQLMAAGANQQLIVSKLEPPPPPPPKPEPPKPHAPEKPKQPPKPAPAMVKKKDDGVLSVSHGAEKADSQEVEIEPNEIHIDEQGNLKTSMELKAEQKQKKTIEPPKEPTEEEEKETPEIKDVPLEPAPPATPEPPLSPFAPTPPPPPPAIIPSPSSFPSLPANSSAQLSPSPSNISESDMPGHHSLLNPTDHQPALSAPFNANSPDGKPTWEDSYNTTPIDPLTNSSSTPQGGALDHDKPAEPTYAGTQFPQLSSTPDTSVAAVQPDASGNLSAEDARKAVEVAREAAPFDPAFKPEERFGSTAVDLPLHTPPAEPSPVQQPVASGTPSLTLPGDSSLPAPPGVPVGPPPPAPPPITHPGGMMPNSFAPPGSAPPKE